MIISFIQFNKLVKSKAANVTWALELCAVATSNNRRQQHCQLQWMQLKPSPIAMDAINTIIMRRQSAHKTSLLNATRKAIAISLKAAGNKHDKGIVRALWASQGYSSHNNEYCRKGVNHCKVCTMNANWNIPPTSAGVKGCTLDARTATIVTIRMADASSSSSATTVVAATTSATSRKVSPSVRTRASSPDAYTASTPINRMTSAVLIHAT